MKHYEGLLERMTIKQNDMSTGRNVKMSRMPDHTTHFLPVSLNHAWLTIILCVCAVEPEVLYSIQSLGWQGKRYIFKTQRH